MGYIENLNDEGNGPVLANDKTVVMATYLKYKGAQVYEPDGTPYVVSSDFSFDDFIQKYRLNGTQLQSGLAAGGPAGYLFYQIAVASVLFYNFRTCGPDELQRSYHGERHYDWRGFVAAFTPVASFVYGVAAAILDAPEGECYAGGGVQNIYNKYLEGNPDIDDSGALWNNPNNVMHIKAGYRFVDHYVHWWGLSDP